MKKTVIVSCSCIITAAIFLLTASTKKEVSNVVIKNSDAAEKGFVVMELFTSQGCSSCPPADEILGKYAQLNDKQVIALAFHVDYWNRLGWVDSFSNSKFSQRQRDYATILNTESVYTPQLVINGEKEMVGSDTGEIEAAVNSAVNEKPSTGFYNVVIENKEGRAAIKYLIAGAIENIQIYAALVENKVFTNIKAGENRGVKLFNYNVVRDFIMVRKKDDSIILHLPKSAIANDFVIVLLAQDKNSGKIVGAYKQQAE